MLYEIAHYIKDKLGFFWDLIEWGNAKTFFLRYHNDLKRVDEMLAKQSDKYMLRQVREADCGALAEFFTKQPEEAFEFFQCHGFDEKSLAKLARRESQLMFIALKGDEIVGYCFMRSFFNGQTYRGYMVDANHRGQGIAKIMGYAMNDVANSLGLKMFKSISPNNAPSMAVTKSVCDINIVKTLDNGDLLVECIAKKK